MTKKKDAVTKKPVSGSPWVSYPPATDFTGIPLLRGPVDAIRLHRCPVCGGRGRWNISASTQAFCGQCESWGWVSELDKWCVHDFAEQGGRGSTHVYRCRKCPRLRSTDSSD